MKIKVTLLVFTFVLGAALGVLAYITPLPPKPDLIDIIWLPGIASTLIGFSLIMTASELWDRRQDRKGAQKFTGGIKA
jgi:hypothetical protein